MKKEFKTHVFGFIPPVIDEKHFILGAARSLPKVVVRPDGQWDAFLPKAEFQRNEYIDTHNCTAYGTENAIEILTRARFGIDLDFSERDLGIRAGTRPPGNDPQIVAEAMRLQGMIPDGMLPFESRISTIEEYYSYPDTKTATNCDTSASLFLKKYDIGHEWAFDPGDYPLEVQRAKMKECLTYSPLAIALYAWEIKSEGLYYRPEGAPDVHWCVIYGFYENGDWKCFDSYDYTEKRLDKDFGFTFVKRYHIEKKTDPAANVVVKPKFSLWQWILSLFNSKKYV